MKFSHLAALDILLKYLSSNDFLHLPWKQLNSIIAAMLNLLEVDKNYQLSLFALPARATFGIDFPVIFTFTTCSKFIYPHSVRSH